MTDNHDPLKELWQQQSVNVPSKKALQARWRKEKTKQYWYTGSDILGFLVGPLFLIFLKDKMHWFEISWLAFIVFITTIYTGYIIWLRRLAFSHQDAAIADYLELLKTQYRQNVKIANATKYSVLAIPPLFIAMFVGVYYLNLFEPERFFRKLVYAGLILAVFLPGLWVWADRRAKRFQRELALLSPTAPLI